MVLPARNSLGAPELEENSIGHGSNPILASSAKRVAGEG